ncbi:MAG: hypothetical protein AABZ29_10030 [Gemmatimonadota bacterium]
MRPCVRLLATLALIAPISAWAQGLFRKSDPLEITIITGLGALIRDRDSTDRVMHGAELSYKDSSGAAVKVAISLRTRGHFRRQARNCDFPPLKVEMTREAAKNTLFEGNRTLKLASSCRPSRGEYEQYILQEFALYRMYQALTPWSYRTRLAHVTYQDSTGKTKPVQSWAFFVENDGDLAQRRNARKIDIQGASFDDLEATKFGYLQLFQYMAGNTDWSVSGLHNITLLQDSVGVVHPVPFDFDWSGAVDARYAFPDRSLPIRLVRERLWRGDCRTAEAMAPVIERFLSRRAEMDSTYMTLTPMAPPVREKVRKYFAEFWPLLDDPKRLVSEFKRTCVIGN